VSIERPTSHASVPRQLEVRRVKAGTGELRYLHTRNLLLDNGVDRSR
jgi:hypothetical protein